MEYYPYVHQNKWLLRVGKFIDKIWMLFFKKPATIWDIPAQNIRRIVVFESHLIGDCVMTTGLVTGLAQAFPHARIDILANRWMSSLMPDGTYPGVDHVFTCSIPWSTYNYSVKNLLFFWRKIREIRRFKYDLAIETRGEIRNTATLWALGARYRVGVSLAGGQLFLTHSVQNADPLIPNWQKRVKILHFLGSPNTTLATHIFVSDEDKRTVETYLAAHGLQAGAYVVFHPGGSHSKKSFTLEQIQQLFIGYQGPPVVVAYGPQETALITELQTSGSLGALPSCHFFSGSFGAFYTLAHNAQWVLTSDSGPAHIASASGATCFIVCPHSSPRSVAPGTPTAHMLAYQAVKDSLSLKHIEEQWQKNLCLQKEN